MLITDRLVVDGGWVERKDVTCFNLYRPPRIELGDAKQGRALDRARPQDLTPDDAEHSFTGWRTACSSPGEKINHALVLGGAQGIGKDTLLEPVKHAVGPWNFHEISPTHLLGPFNSFAKSVILRINEAAISARSTASSSTTTPRSTPPLRVAKYPTIWPASLMPWAKVAGSPTVRGSSIVV